MKLCAKLTAADNSDVLSNQFDVLDIEKALAKLKAGKASGIVGIVKEHLVYSHPSVVVYLMLLFNMTAIHGFVPDDFGAGVMVPIVKDTAGDITDVGSYRGITR